MAGERASFDRAEYEARIARTRRAIAERGIELLIVTDPSNMAWLTGYDGWSFYVHQCVLLADDREPISNGRGQDAHGPRGTSAAARPDRARPPGPAGAARTSRPPGAG